MAVQTETIIDVMISGVKVDEFGISDTIDNYSDSEIADFIYVGANSRMLGGNIDIYSNTSGSYDTWQNGMPFDTGSVTSSIMTMKSGYGTYECPAEGRYLGVVLLHNIYNNIYNDYITVGSSQNYVILTEINAKKYLLDISAGLLQVDSRGAIDFTDKTADLYNPQFTSVAFKYNNAGTYEYLNYDFVPYYVLQYGGYLYLINAFNINQTSQFRCSFNQSPPWNAGTVYNPLSYNDVSKSISVAFNGYGFGTHWNNISDDDFVWAYGAPAQRYCESDYVHLFADFGARQFRCYYYYKTYDEMMMMYANSGMYFRINSHTVFKPLIDNNVVYGFTDQLDAESDIDNYDGSTKHDIPVTPPTPPTPPPGPDYEDDPWSGATFAGTSVGGAGAFAKVYYMTATELANLRSWMNSISVPEGFDPMAQIIGLSQVPVALSGSSSENVVFVNSSAVYDPGVTTRAVDTGVATQQAMGTPISYYLGSVDIVRRMQERGEPYLDYDCQIELYLPLIGMFSLDTQAVMSRTISAYAVLDPVSGTLAAYAYVTKDGQNLPVAYGSTTIGIDLPISAQQLSVSRAALKQANAQLGTSLLSSALSMIAISSSGGKGSSAGAKTTTGSSGVSAAGIREAGGDYMKASQVGNVFGDFMNWGRTIRQLSYGNNTAIAGSFGGSTAQWAYPFTPYVKIIRPRFEKPNNYAHSQGVPYVHTKKVGECTGFIQCINADVSGITRATDLERQAIQAALNNGVFAGGGS